MDNSVFSISNITQTTLGTGFVIDTNQEGSFIATCGHVVNNCGDSIIVEGIDANVIENYYDDGIDLAVLYVKGLKQKALLLNENYESELGSVIGFSKLLSDPKKEPILNIPLKSNIVIEKPNNLKVSSLKLTPVESISKGYSGSPVICDATKKVVGIVNIQLGSDANYAICAKHLLDIYPSLRVKNDVATDIIVGRKVAISSPIEEKDIFLISHKLNQTLEDSLQSFSIHSINWVEPQLYSIEEKNRSQSKQKKIRIDSIISEPRNIEIFAKQEYGSTCLAHYLINTAWNDKAQSFWLYIDTNDLKPFSKHIKQVINRKLKVFKLDMNDVECVVLDEYSKNIKDADKILKELSLICGSIPIILITKEIQTPLIINNIEHKNIREFEPVYLWSLPRTSIRTLVKQYNTESYIENEDRVVNKVISDLEAINIPRTPQNCLTLLKISELNFDDSPVNRAEMIHRFLSLLFNYDDLPKYKSRPDLKDTEHILGYLCAEMLKSKEYFFTCIEFTNKLKDYCDENEIDLEVHVIFDILCKNNILIGNDHQFHFKFSFWIFYFAAHRMLYNKEFANFIMSENNYLDYPEVIEFYSGIDRQRNDLLEKLKVDLSEIKGVVIDRCALPQNFNIFDYAKWVPSEQSLSIMSEQISDGVLSSNLPDEIKDNYADRSYDSTRPLKQSINTILEEYSVLRLVKCIRASSQVLRNSSYAEVKLKHTLVDEILSSLNELSKVLISIAPILNKNGAATVEGAGFILSGYFGKTNEERLRNIIQLVPSNINKWFKNDIFSEKIGTMLIKRALAEEDLLQKHMLNLLIITKRPKGWESYIEKYLENEDKNSFYLFDIFRHLNEEYQFSYSSGKSLNYMKQLIKKSLAKHKFDNPKKIKRLLKNVIPKRDETKL